MRHLFFLFLAGTLGLAVVIWALYMFGQAILQLFDDWKLGRELDELEADSAARRQRRERARAQRLANGCDHDFSSGAIGLPPRVCTKCGLEEERPAGQCDHVWRVKPGPVPSSACEHCGKTYHPLQPTSGPPSR